MFNGGGVGGITPLAVGIDFQFNTKLELQNPNDNIIRKTNIVSLFNI